MATPRAASASLRENTALAAPRNLKAPTFWKFSHLKNSSAPVRPFRAAQVNTGVRWAYGRMRSAARSMSARVGVPGGRPETAAGSTFSSIPPAIVPHPARG